MNTACSLTVKDFMYFVHENYQKEYELYVRQFNAYREEDRWNIGAIFCSTLENQPKKKAMYNSFLERQENQDPKFYRNVLRFLNEMNIKTEFQCQ